MRRVVVRMDLRVGERCFKALQKVPVKDEVLETPENQRWTVFKRWEERAHLLDGVPRAIALF